MDFLSIDADAVAAEMRLAFVTQAIRDETLAAQEVARLDAVVADPSFRPDLREAAQAVSDQMKALHGRNAALASKTISKAKVSKKAEADIRKAVLSEALTSNEREYQAKAAELDFETDRHALIPQGDEADAHAARLVEMQDGLRLVEVTHGVLVAALA